MQMAMGVVGGVIGAYLGGPMGAQIGFALGSYAGGVLDPQKVYGSRLNDTKINTAGEGSAKPILFGENRLAGQIIWQIPFTETETSSKGGTVEKVSYSYAADFALCIGSGIVDDIVEIKFNYENWFTNNENSSVTDLLYSMKQGGSFTFYNGSEEQKPDSYIQSFAGKSKTSAYKGEAYLVFKKLPLEKFGNRLPNIEVICKKNGIFYLVTYKAYEVENNFNGNYEVSSSFYPSVNQSKQQVYIEYYKTANDKASSNITFSSCDILEDGTVIEKAIFTPASFNVQDMTLTAHSKSKDGSTLMITRSLVDYTWKYYNLWADGTATSLEAYKPDDNRNSYNYGLGFAMSVKDDTHLFMSTYNDDPSTNPYRQAISLVRFYGTIAQSGITINPGFRLNGMAIGINYLYVSDVNNNIHRYDLDLNYVDLFWSIASDISGDTEHTVGFAIQDIDTDSNILYAIDSRRNFYEIKKNNLVFLNQASTVAQFSKIHFKNGSFFGYSGQPVNQILWYINRTTRTKDIQLSTVVSEICKIVGLLPNQYNVSELEDDYLRGYIISSTQPARQAIQMLANTFFFDIVESAGVLVFTKRGKQPIVIIDEADFVVTDGQEDHIKITIGSTIELPYKLNFGYYDVDNDFQTCSQFSRRETVSNQNTSNVQATVSITASQAKAISNVILYSAWNERTSFDFSLSNKYLYLEPSDVIGIIKNGIIYYVRIITINYQNNVLSIQAVEDDYTVYEQKDVVGSQVEYSLTTSIKRSSPSNLQLLDIPLLRDQDDRVGYYLSVGPYSANSTWSGCVLYKSTDSGQSFYPIESAKTRIGVIGYSLNVLGDFKTGYIFDELNSVTVKVNSSLFSTSELNILNGSNYAVLGNEIIQYKNAVLIDVDTYRLSGCLRGCLGTEREISNHTSSDRFIALNISSIYVENGISSEIGLERKIKAVSFDENISDAIVKKFTYNAVSSKPYSPVLLGGGRDSDGNLTLQWTRRTRIGGSWSNNTDVPLGETSEVYSVDILRLDNSVIRTIDNIHSQNTIYSKEQQISDFGSIQSSVKFKVFQVSSFVGRGFGQIASV